MDVIKILQDMKMDQPDSSQWSFDAGWNAALDEAIKKIEAAPMTGEELLHKMDEAIARNEKSPRR